jgi:hypothetical protein
LGLVYNSWGTPMAVIPQKARFGGAAVLLVALLLSGCIDSIAPLLDQAQPVFGPSLRVHAYSLTEGRATGPDVGVFRWDGGQYRVVGRPTFDVASFTATAFEGNDLIIQSRSSQPKVSKIEYALARKEIDGVYLVSGIDEDDADEATRATFCTKDASSSCRIATRDALLAFARVTAAKSDRKGGLAIIMYDRRDGR